jgi:hypothetical protein
MKTARRRAGESGQDLIEYALVLPFLLTLTLVLAELALVIFQYNVVANAAREGARAGIVIAGSDSAVAAASIAAAEGRAVDSGLPLERLEVTATLTGGVHRRLQVVVQYQAQLISAPVIQAIGGDSAGLFTLQAASSMLRE